MNESLNSKQSVVLQDRTELFIDGVENILNFDETYVGLATVYGKLNIEGRELKVDSLTRDDGKIHITGKICGIFYSSDDSKKSGLGKLFK